MSALVAVFPADPTNGHRSLSSTICGDSQTSHDRGLLPGGMALRTKCELRNPVQSPS